MLALIASSLSLSSSAFHLGLGYGYEKSSYSFITSDHEIREAEEINHDLTIDTKGFIGQGDSFGIGLSLDFKFPQNASYTGASQSLPWSIGSDLTFNSRISFTKGNEIGLITRLGCGINYRSAERESLPDLGISWLEKAQILDFEMVTGIGLYSDIAERINLELGINISTPLAKYYKASGSSDGISHSMEGYQKFSNPSGLETKGYITISYIFKDRNEG